MVFNLQCFIFKTKNATIKLSLNCAQRVFVMLKVSILFKRFGKITSSFYKLLLFLFTVLQVKILVIIKNLATIFFLDIFVKFF